MADPAAPPPPSTGQNPVPDQAPATSAQQEEQRRLEAERITNEHRTKTAHDDRMLNTVALTAPAAPVINPDGINPKSPLCFLRMNDSYYCLLNYPLVVGFTALDPTQNTQQ